MSLFRCVSWHRAMISPWAGVEHLDGSDSQLQQRVFVSCWGMCRGFHCVYAGRWLGQERRAWEGCDGSENSPDGLGLPARLLDACCGSFRRGLRSRKDWTHGGEDGRRLDLP